MARGCNVYAYGIRNAGGGLAIDPKTGELWCSVNERDGLGDNLVPDYITHVEEGGFYGWPWWYIGSHQDPRHEGKHPELKNKVHRSRRAVAAPQCIARDDVLSKARNSRLNIRETFSRPSTVHGTDRCAPDMK